MNHWIEISEARLAENFCAVQSAVGEDVETLAVIKADGYGHGAALCAPVLTKAGARWLGVMDVDEGARVREALGEEATRILVMCGMQLSDATKMVAQRLTPVVWTVEQVSAMERAAEMAGQCVAVHVEVDTGMARLGVAVGEDVSRLLEKLAVSQWVWCEGVMTHLCCSEVAGAATTAVAERLFAEVLAQVGAAGLRPEFVHLGNTSAVDEGSTMLWVREQAKMLGARAMVRTGLAIYGYCLPLSNAVARLHSKVRPVLTWKAGVIGVREVEAGATVGYGATFVAEKRMRLALLPVGYADGFRREASSGLGHGWVMLGGERAAVMGRVSMNLMVVDVTAIEGVVEEVEAVLLGEGVTAEDHARWAETIPYEILCGLRGARLLR